MVTTHSLSQNGPRTHYARPISNASNFSSPVSIIVPFHGKYELCTQLVDSILRLTKSNYYELCLVDDASPNKEYLERAEKNLARRNSPISIKCIRCEEQLGFGGAAKVGYDNTENPYIVVVNSDCLITNGNWLRGLGESLLEMKKDGVKMISSKTDNPVGGSLKQKGNKNENSDNLILENDEHLSLYCFMCHRDLFYHIHGFIKEYPIGYYEDEELAFRMKKYGFKQGVSGKSWVHHEGEATIKYLLRKRSEEIRQIMDQNYERCLLDMQKK
jgi:glycosyltransferase involved in cell wall biosynthesis